MHFSPGDCVASGGKTRQFPKLSWLLPLSLSLSFSLSDPPPPHTALSAVCMLCYNLSNQTRQKSVKFNANQRRRIPIFGAGPCRDIHPVRQQRKYDSAHSDSRIKQAFFHAGALIEEKNISISLSQLPLSPPSCTATAVQGHPGGAPIGIVHFHMGGGG